MRINLHNPFPPALANLAGLGFIMQKGHYDNAPAKPDGKKDFGAVPPNGTGPYRITEVKPGQSILMVKNPDYFKGGFKGEPAICKILFRTIKDANTRAAELMTGAIDWIWDVPKDQAERLQANPGAGGRERQDAARLLSAVRRAGRVGAEVLHRQARAPGGGACDQPRVADQEPGGTGLGRRPLALPSRPVRVLAEGDASTPTIRPRPRRC